MQNKIQVFLRLKGLYLGFYDGEKDNKAIENINRAFAMVADPNEQVSYLRAILIGKLIQQCFRKMQLKPESQSLKARSQ